jgi:cytochrome c biogenesis factor
MQILAHVLRLCCFAFALFLLYQVSTAIYQQNYVLMDIVANVGTILICIDLGFFLNYNKLQKLSNATEAQAKAALEPTKVEKFTRKLGHLGIMLIICSWIVPLIK